MKTIRNIVNKIFNFFELHLPSVVFSLIFITYIITIFSRYVFKIQISSVYELNTLMFIWCAVLAASYGGRTGKHIMFTILYDKFPEKIKVVCRIIGDLFVVVTFGILFPYAYKAISFMHIKKSSILRIPFDLVFSPFLIFVLLTFIYNAASLFQDIKLAVKVLRKDGKI